MTTSYKSIMIQHDPPPFSAYILYLFFVPEGAMLLPRVPNHLQVQPAKWYLGRNLLSMKNSSARNRWCSIQYTCYIFLLVYFPIILPNQSTFIYIHIVSFRSKRIHGSKWINETVQTVASVAFRLSAGSTEVLSP